MKSGSLNSESLGSESLGSGSREWVAWPVQDAKARFSELLDTCVREGPQVVSRRGAELAVLVPMEQWRRLQARARPSLKELLLHQAARSDALVPPRGRANRRQPPAL